MVPPIEGKGKESAGEGMRWGGQRQKEPRKGHKTAGKAVTELRVGEYPWGDQIVLPAGRTPDTSGNPHKGGGYGKTRKRKEYRSQCRLMYLLPAWHFTDSLPTPRSKYTHP